MASRESRPWDNKEVMPIRRRANHALQQKLDQMRLVLAPIYPLPDGPPHSAFPRTLLHFWLLTEEEIDSMACYYHQISPSNPWRTQYPACMNWDAEFLAKPDPQRMSKEELKSLLPDEERLSVKRRMVGKFIGLRGCSTPMPEINRRVRLLEEKFERALKAERESTGGK